jgi:hypothetical protein
MSESGGAVARTGNQPSWTPTTTTRIVPVMNSGMDDVVTPIRTIARSLLPSLRLAAYKPARMLIGMVMSNARPASLAERPTAPRSCGKTGWPDTNDSPKSKVTMPWRDST